MTGQPLTFDATPEEMVIFLSEAEEQMELLSQDLLRLEHEGDANSELLQEIFRAAHTLKGSSGAIGHQRMARLTHAIETVLDQVRRHLLPVTTQMIDLLLQGVDALRVLLDEVTTLVESDIAIDALCHSLNALAAPAAEGVANPAPATSPEVFANPSRGVQSPADAPGTPPVPVPVAVPQAPLWRVEAQIAESCLLPSVRALQVLLAAANLGEVVESDPANEVVEGGKVTAGSTLTLWLKPSISGDIAEQIRAAVGNILEVTVSAVTPEGDIVPSAAPADADDASGALWRVTVAINERCPLPAARALQVVLACGAAGTVRASEPTLEAIETGQANACREVTVWLARSGSAAETLAAVRAEVERIPEVTVTDVTADAVDAAPVSSPEGFVFPSRGVQPPAGVPGAHLAPAAQSIPAGVTVAHLAPAAQSIPAGVTVAHLAPAAQSIPAGVPGAHLASAVQSIPAGVPGAHLAPAAQSIPAGALGDPFAPVLQPAPTGVPGAQPAPAPSTPTPAKATEHPEGGAANGAAAAHAPRMVRIDVERLDALMNLVGELVIDRTRLARIANKVSQQSGDAAMAEELTETCRHLARISDDLQDEVMRSRMLPIESVFSKFPRLVRDLAQKVGKKIDFIVEGKDTELDRSVAEQIGDPIIHLLRNSIDHGIEPAEKRLAAGKSETGQVRLAARHEENQIVIDVEDDGRGIDAEVIKQKAVSKGIISAEAAARMGDREALDLIFAPGFSTAEQISDISGRGVGMDIVRTNVERLSGSITVETEVGQGTRFTVRLPLTLAIIRALLIDVAGQTFAIPLTSVVEALRIERDKLRSVNGHEAIELRGEVLPLMRLRDIFAEELAAGQQENAERAQRQFVVAVRWGDRRGGLIVDALIGEQEIVIKPLGNLFRAAHGISGGAVLGDGQVAPILDIPALIKHIISAERGVGVAA